MIAQSLRKISGINKMRGLSHHHLFRPSALAALPCEGRLPKLNQGRLAPHAGIIRLSQANDDVQDKFLQVARNDSEAHVLQFERQAKAKKMSGSIELACWFKGDMSAEVWVGVIAASRLEWNLQPAIIKMTPAGLEPAIPGSVVRCLIHWATGPDES